MAVVLNPSIGRYQPSIRPAIGGFCGFTRSRDPRAFPSLSPLFDRSLSLATEFFVLHAVFFSLTCALVNYCCFLRRTHLLPWLRSLLAFALQKQVEKPKADEEDDDEGDSLVEEEKELARIFPAFDRDENGFVSASELEESLRRLGLTITAAEVAP